MHMPEGVTVILMSMEKENPQDGFILVRKEKGFGYSIWSRGSVNFNASSYQTRGRASRLGETVIVGATREGTGVSRASTWFTKRHGRSEKKKHTEDSAARRGRGTRRPTKKIGPIKDIILQ